MGIAADSLIGVFLIVLILCTYTSAQANDLIEHVNWLCVDDFADYQLGEIIDERWTFFSNRRVSWSIEEFDEASSGRVLKASNKDDKQNRAILNLDVSVSSKTRIVFQSKVWVDRNGLLGVDLWNCEMNWPNYVSVHPWNLGIFADSDQRKSYLQTVVFDLENRTAEIYVDGVFLKILPFRDNQVPPEYGVYRLGISFAGADGSNDVLWDYIKVGVLDMTDNLIQAPSKRTESSEELLWISEVKWQDPDTKTYLGSPSLIRLNNGDILATHDYFGPDAPKDTLGRSNMTSVYVSKDDGKTWEHSTDLVGIYWATLFEHHGNVYLLGNSSGMGGIAIVCSQDGGSTWTEAVDDKSGLLFRPGQWGMPPRYHGAPVPVLEVDGRLYRAFENAADPDMPGMRGYLTFVISVDAEKDLLDASNWRMSNEIYFNGDWDPPGSNPTTGWLEGNVVEGPDGRLWNILRVNSTPYVDRAAMVEIHEEGSRVTFEPDNFIRFPGGQSKFVIRKDKSTGLYWTITNNNTSPAHSSQRNVLSLYVSPDLRSWYHAKTLMNDDQGMDFGDSVRVTGFQYADWQFDGDDIIYLVRTAYNGAPNYHDSNRITFGRVSRFRSLTPDAL
ncbi:MAG: glycoside hydrolase [Limnochordia bacterium]|nr:glycoside hydrolase [Limnochordia bacterium]